MEQRYHEANEAFEDEKFYDCAEGSAGLIIPSASKPDITEEPNLAELSLTDPTANIALDVKSSDFDNDATNEKECSNIDAEIREKYFVDEEFMRQNELNDNSDFDGRKNEAIALKARGNEHFRQLEYEAAADLYTEALKVCPVKRFSDLRSVLFSNRAACFSKLDLVDDAIADCSTAISYDQTYIKPLLRRAQLYENKDLPDKALQDYELVLQKEPCNAVAKCNTMRLAPIVRDKNEKMKEEMMGKLKDLGNIFLRPFGLSTDNFQLQPNESGGYSVKMQK